MIDIPLYKRVCQRCYVVFNSTAREGNYCDKCRLPLGNFKEKRVKGKYYYKEGLKSKAY